MAGAPSPTWQVPALSRRATTNLSLLHDWMNKRRPEARPEAMGEGDPTVPYSTLQYPTVPYRAGDPWPRHGDRTAWRPQPPCISVQRSMAIEAPANAGRPPVPESRRGLQPSLAAPPMPLGDR